MNINTSNLSQDIENGFQRDLGLTLAHHAAIMGRQADLVVTGRVALVTDPDPVLAVLGVMRVWLEADDETGRCWVWVDDEGVIVKSTTPVTDL